MLSTAISGEAVEIDATSALAMTERPSEDVAGPKVSKTVNLMGGTRDARAATSRSLRSQRE